MKSSRIALSAVAAVGALGLSACGAGSGEPTADAAGGTLTIGVIQDLTSWDTAEAHVGHGLMPYQIAYDTLLRRDPDGDLVPMLATEWSYDETRTALTLELRDDVTFSDGEVFDAEAVKANLEYFRDAKGRQAVQVQALESVEVVDDDTVVIHLSQPDPAFDFSLSQAAGLMGSPATLGDDAVDTVPVGSGPYVMSESETVAGSQIVFTAREGYWAPDLQKYDRVVMRVLTDVSARLNALQSGQVDVTVLDASTYDQAVGAGLEVIEDYQTDWNGLIFFDRGGDLNPALADVRVRQAINYAVDRQALVDQIERGHGTPTAQPFGPDSGAYVEELDELYPHDPERARALLEEAGYADGMTIRVPMLPGWDGMHAAVRQQLGEVGITMESVPVQFQSMFGEIAQGRYETLYFNLFQSEAWVNVQQLLVQGTLYNPFNTSSPELDALIEEMRLAGADTDEQAQQINRYVTENAWFAPFYRLDQVVAYDADKLAVVAQPQQAIPSIYNFSPAK